MDCLKKDMMIKLCNELYYKGDMEQYVFETVSINSYDDGEIVVKGYLYLLECEEDYCSIDMYHYYDEAFGDITRIEYFNAEGFIARRFYYIHHSEELYTARDFINMQHILDTID